MLGFLYLLILKALETLVRRVTCMVFSLAKRRIRSSRRTLEETLKKDLIVNCIFENLVFNKSNGIV